MEKDFEVKTWNGSKSKRRAKEPVSNGLPSLMSSGVDSYSQTEVLKI